MGLASRFQGVIVMYDICLCPESSIAHLSVGHFCTLSPPPLLSPHFLIIPLALRLHSEPCLCGAGYLNTIPVLRVDFAGGVERLFKRIFFPFQEAELGEALDALDAGGEAAQSLGAALIMTLAMNLGHFPCCHILLFRYEFRDAETWTS